MERMVRILEPICTSLVVLGNCPTGNSPAPAGISRLSDQHPGLGPMSGLETLLASGLGTRYLVVGCDQPLLTTDLLRRLIAQSWGCGAAFYCRRSGESLAPLPGIYPAEWLQAVRRAIDGGHLSLRRLADECPCQWVGLTDPEAAQVESINTAEQARQLGIRL